MRNKNFSSKIKRIYVRIPAWCITQLPFVSNKIMILKKKGEFALNFIMEPLLKSDFTIFY